jgi:hypothetical protein
MEHKVSYNDRKQISGYLGPNVTEKNKLQRVMKYPLGLKLFSTLAVVGINRTVKTHCNAARHRGTCM